MDEFYRMVEFHKYCETCKYKELDDCEDPCNECLDHPVNLYSERPVNWVEKEK